MTLTAGMLIGLIISVFGIAGLAIYTGTRPKTSGKVNKWPICAGIIMGTLVGGSSTVGTAQLAYNYGMSAWWFTLGGGIACLILALIYAKPLRDSECVTLVGIISKEYGKTSGMIASILSAVGTFINVISQLISATAVIAVIFPNLSLIVALIISAAFMIIYVIFGGTKGVGLVGILKLVLLYISMISCGVLVLSLTKGVQGFKDLVATIDNPNNVNFASLIARGAGKDIGACLSLILGVLTTQTYAQAVFTAKTDRDARTGALVSAFLIPPIGIGGILVGLYMRANFPGIAAKTALTAFVSQNLPGVLGGIVLGALFIAVVGTGAGLSLGISTIIRRDIISNFTDKFNEEKKANFLQNLIIVIVLVCALLLSNGKIGDTILVFAFMSMGMRGAVVFVPMCCALWLKGKINKNWAIAGIIAGPIVTLIFGGIIKIGGTPLALPAGLDSLFAGILASIICHAIGLAVGQKKDGKPLEA